MELILDTKFVSRHLRVAIREWYSWLSDKAMHEDEWKAVPHWCKQIPSRLDIPWALHDMEKHAQRRQLIRALYIVIDEVYMSSEGMENVPSIAKLRNHLFEWYGKAYG